MQEPDPTTSSLSSAIGTKHAKTMQSTQRRAGDEGRGGGVRRVLTPTETPPYLVIHAGAASG